MHVIIACVCLCIEVLHNKFGKEFGLKEVSEYKGLVKTAKPRKKPSVLAPSLGLKMKDLITEALQATGNPVSFLTFLPFFFLTKAAVIV
jgi:hypothetical protein